MKVGGGRIEHDTNRTGDKLNILYFDYLNIQRILKCETC
jgi:hypothetical protein